MSGPGLGGSFWRLFTSSSASNLADGIGIVVFPLLAASLTRDPLLISLLSALRFLPWLLFAIPGGALVDRMDRRFAMAGANVFRAVLLAGMVIATVTGALTIWLIFAVTVLFGTAEVLYDSAARAVLPAVVEREQLDRGNSLLTVSELTTQGFIGSPVGSFLFGIAVALPIFGIAGCFAAAGLLALTLRGSFRPHRETATTMRADVREGMSWLWRHRFLRGLTIGSGLVGLFQAAPNAVLVLYLLESVSLHEEVFGLWLAGVAVGGVVGGVLAPAIGRLLGRDVALGVSAVVGPAAVAAMGLVADPYSACALFALSAAAVTVWNVLSMSIRQQLIPDALFGRVLGVYRMVIWGGIPLGALGGGALASWLGVRAVFVIAGLAQVLIGVWLWRLTRTHRDQIAGTATPATVP
jgi:MFS family permease